MQKAVLDYIARWKLRGYPDGIPDEVPERLMYLGKAPSYRQISIAILSNDVRQLGASRPKSRWYSEYKRIELEERNGTN